MSAAEAETLLCVGLPTPHHTTDMCQVRRPWHSGDRAYMGGNRQYLPDGGDYICASNDSTTDFIGSGIADGLPDA